MFSRRPTQTESARHRAGKATRSQKRSFRDHSISKHQSQRDKTASHHPRSPSQQNQSPPLGSTLTSPIITLVVGPTARLFAAHADVLCLSPFFAAAVRGQFLEAHARRIDLPEESPEIFSSVLEYLYKGDYYPRLLHNKRRNTWELEDSAPQGSPDGTARGAVESTIYHTPHPTSPAGSEPVQLLKDTVIYCLAEKFSLPDLKRLALRKQGLQQGVQCSTIISSARYAYEHTPESDGKMRAHYLALIIRCRGVFKRSGTMQMEMEKGGIGGGGGLWFDLFVAMSGHLDDVTGMKMGR